MRSMLGIVRGMTTRRIVRAWMAAGAVVMGMATSPAFALQVQPRGEARVKAPEQDRGDREGADGAVPVLPALPTSTCDPFAGMAVRDGMLAQLAHATQARTLAERRARVPEALRDAFEQAIAGPARFHAALFGNELGEPQIGALYVLEGAPQAGRTLRALASDAHAFEATMYTTRELDLRAGAEALGDPSRAPRVGEAAWDVTGIGTRQGRAREFRGMVLAIQMDEGLIHWLFVEQDTACEDIVVPELRVQPLAPSLPDRAIYAGDCYDQRCVDEKYAKYDELVRSEREALTLALEALQSDVAGAVAVMQAHVQLERAMAALDLTAVLRWCRDNLQRIAPWLALRCAALLWADRVLGNLLLWFWLWFGTIRIDLTGVRLEDILRIFAQNTQRHHDDVLGSLEDECRVCE